jgi:amidophosphoribosyltransferase
VIVAASERAAIRTAFNVGENEVKELMPGQAMIVNHHGEIEIAQILEPKERKACSFERIYFSRGSDEKIYNERKALGYHLSKQVLEAIDYDLKNTIFSFIPNTAEVAFYGLIKGCENWLNEIKVERISSWTTIDPDKLHEMINLKVRMEKIAIKDVKMRTFISEDAGRNEMVQHVYDVTYGTVRKNEDTLVVIDDSIVRGTTSREIVQMAQEAGANKVYFASAAPPVRFPNVYGIDMPTRQELIATGRDEECLAVEHRRFEHLALQVAGVVRRQRAVHDDAPGRKAPDERLDVGDRAPARGADGSHQRPLFIRFDQ